MLEKRACGACRPFESTHESIKDAGRKLGLKFSQPSLSGFQALLQGKRSHKGLCEVSDKRACGGFGRFKLVQKSIQDVGREWGEKYSQPCLSGLQALVQDSLKVNNHTQRSKRSV